MADRSSLTDKQRAFCRLCAEGISPKEAARLAGYKDASKQARQLLQMSKIQRSIERRKNRKTDAPQGQTKAGETAAQAVAGGEEILTFLTEMMREDEDSRMRMRAAELLGKRVSLFEGDGKAQDSRIIIVDDIS